MAPTVSTKATVLRADSGSLWKGLIALVAGLALLAHGLDGGAGPFVMGPGFVIALGAMVALYGASVLVVVLWTRNSLRLSRAEWSEWGPTLEERREEIIGRILAGDRTAHIADELQAAVGLPQDVTLRYIIYVGRQIQASSLR